MTDHNDLDNHSHPIQTVTLDHDCSAVLVVPGTDANNHRVFYDLGAMATMLVNNGERNLAMLDMLGIPDDSPERAMLLGQAIIFAEMADALVQFSTTYEAQTVLGAGDTLADFGLLPE